MPTQHHDDPRLNTATIKSGIVAGLVAMAREHGVGCDGWFSGLRLGPAAFDGETPVYLSYRQACQIMRRAMRSLPVHGPGLVLGQQQGIGHFGLLGLAMLTAPQFAQALQLGIRYAPITGAMMELELDEHDDGAMSVVARMVSTDPELEPFLCEELFASSLMLCRGLLGPGFRPRLVELAYREPAYGADYAELFDCEVRFGCPRNRVVIDASWLRAPMPAHNTLSAQQVLALCDEQMPAGAVIIQVKLHHRPGDRRVMHAQLQCLPEVGRGQHGQAEQAEVADVLAHAERQARAADGQAAHGAANDLAGLAVGQVSGVVAAEFGRSQAQAGEPALTGYAGFRRHRHQARDDPALDVGYAQARVVDVELLHTRR